MYRDKPRLPVIRLLNDLADKAAILRLLGHSEGFIDAKLMAVAERRIAPARPREPEPEREWDWREGRWTRISPEQEQPTGS
jgi:hypothetical protein